ncbi:MAG: hypothetical protein P4L33_14220 [Capsulimonadaceae bacterium]|nr:hypothetical protein [Capsulimonadaceae bacterium]
MSTLPAADPSLASAPAPSPVSRTPAFRSWLVAAFGLPLTFASFLMVMNLEEIQQIGMPTGIAIYYHVVMLFAVLVLLNGLVSRRSGGRLFLSRPEMLCVYSMMNIGTCFACWEALGTLIPAIAYPSYIFASRPSESWLGPVIAALPSWAVVKDPDAARAVFQGGEWSAIWRGWLVPLLAWASLLSALFVMFLALTRMLWESWAHHEHLSFPLTALPLEMTRTDASLWRSRLFWSTSLTMFGFDIVNGLHQIAPSFPTLNIKVIWANTSPVTPGWAAVGSLPLTFHPLMIGIGLLLRTDLLFSTWFFYLLGKAQIYFAGMMAASHGSPYVFLDNTPGLLAQNFGAIIVLGVSLLWNARRMLSSRLDAARDGNREARADFAILAGGVIVLTAALTALGLSAWLAVLSVAIVLLLAVFVSRLRAELGLPVHNLQFMGPDGPLTALFNGHGLTQQTQNAFGAFYAVTRSQQGHAMPHLMESAYMTDRAQGPVSSTWKILAITGILAAFAGPWIVLRLLSQHGLEAVGYNASVSAGGWVTVKSYLMGHHLPDTDAIRSMAGGAGVTLALLALSRAWVSSPFHPVGYAICGSWGTGMVWMPFLIAWAAKSLVLRYGGGKAYGGLSMFAIGLIFGEFAAGLFWTLVSSLTGVQCYQIWLF